MIRHFRSAITQLMSIAVGLVLVFPIVYAVAGAFKTPAEFAVWPPTLFAESYLNFDNFRYVFGHSPMWRYMLNSLITASLTTIVRLTLASLAAYAFAFFDFRGKRTLFLLILITMMLPGETLTITNYRTVSRMSLTDTYLGICIVSFVGASQMFVLTGQFRQIPVELRDAALLDGCGDMRYLARVVLPMSRGILLTLGLQCFITQWNSYLWPLLVTGRDSMRTVQVGITMLTNTEATNYEVVLAGACIAMVPSLLMFFLSRRMMTGTQTGGAVVE